MSTEVEDQVAAALREHDRYVMKMRPRWNSLRDSYEGDAWGAEKRDLRVRQNKGLNPDEYPVLSETNRTRRWVESFVDGLFYKRLEPGVAPPAIIDGDIDEIVHGAEGEPDPASQVRAALAYWSRRTDVEDAAEQAATMGLLYDAAALHVGTDGRKAIDGIWLEAVPPWECLWDRRARSMRTMRYIGRVFDMPREEFEEQFGADTRAAGLEVEQLLVALQDTVANEKHTPADADRAKDHVRVILYFDLFGEWQDADTAAKAPGRQLVFAMDGESNPRLISEDPIPDTWPDGRPLAPIVPIVLLHKPEFRLSGVSPAWNVYKINRELNYFHTFLVNAARTDAARKIAYNKNDIGDQDDLDDLLTGVDNQYVGLELPEDVHVRDVFHAIQASPTAGSLADVITMLETNYAQDAGRSPLARGEALKYASAAEIHTHVDYDESTLGRLRKRLDGAVARMYSVVLRVLKPKMGPTLKMHVDGQEVLLKKEYLDVAWEIELADAAATPLSEAQRRMEFQQAAPFIMDLWERIVQGDPLAEAAYEYLVDLYNLPRNMQLGALKPMLEQMKAKMEEEAAAQAEAQAAAAPPMPTQPMQGDPAAAIVGAVEEASLGPA
jgi:hypothetical protein